MADDILLTPEEQDEKARKWFKDNGFALFLGIALGLGAIFGYNQYQAKQQASAEAASLLYNGILEQVSESEIVDINASVNTLKTDHSTTSYAAKASLLKAAQLSKTDLSAALVEYQWVKANAQEVGLVQTARVREAKIVLAQGDLDKAKSLAAQQPYGSFASHYYEILGDVAMQEGNLEEAYDFYNQSSEQLLASDSSYAAVLGLKMAPLPQPTSADVEIEAITTE